MNYKPYTPSNPSQEIIAVEKKEMTWKDMLLSILEGYVCVMLFFIIARFTPLNFLFRILHDTKIQEQIYFTTMAIFLIAYTIYAVNQIAWFSLRKNGYCSTIHGSIRRFIETCVWCLYAGLIPFVFLTSFLPSNNLFYPWYFDEFSWDMRGMPILFLGLYWSSIMFSSCLVPLILVQRLIITCRRSAANKPIGKPEDNVRFWQSPDASMPISLYSIARKFASIIWEFCYWFAILVLLFTIPIVNMSIQLSASGGSGGGGWGGFAGAMMIVAYTYFVVVAICCLAFSIVVRNLLDVIRRCVRGLL